MFIIKDSTGLMLSKIEGMLTKDKNNARRFEEEDAKRCVEVFNRMDDSNNYEIEEIIEDEPVLLCPKCNKSNVDILRKFNSERKDSIYEELARCECNDCHTLFYSQIVYGLKLSKYITEEKYFD